LERGSARRARNTTQLFFFTAEIRPSKEHGNISEYVLRKTEKVKIEQTTLSVSKQLHIKPVLITFTREENFKNTQQRTSSNAIGLHAIKMKYAGKKSNGYGFSST
jgi:hypothetical protein